MSDISNKNLSQQVYSARDGETLLTQVEKVICVILPRGLLVSGFNNKGEVSLIKYSDYKKDLPTWILDFYEHQFINEPLLAKAEKIMAVFVGSDKSCLFPEDLYDEKTAIKWMHKLFFVEANELIFTHHLHDEKAVYMSTWPASIRSLILRYFDKAKVLPFAAFQFHKPLKTEVLLQCCITNDQVYATLYMNRNIHWHQVFNYENAEDIAFQIKLLCKQKNIDEDLLVINCSITNKILTYTANQLATFFPNFKDADPAHIASDKNWKGTIYLLQQLYSCAL